MGRTHGMSHQRLHNIWLTMRQRCSKPNCSGWHKYGAKGIRVCDEWEHSFEAFRDWAYSHGYDDTLTIDRIDPKGNYEPGNCRWVTQKVQQNNRSNNVKLTYKGETHRPMNGTILSNRSAVDRNKTDFYATPREVTVALLDFLEGENLIDPYDIIWEPASGSGAMEEVMLNRGYAVLGTDLHPQIHGRDSVDFLQANKECDWIITNPPFSKATEFITHALELGKPCAFLLKSQFWHAKSRLDLFRENPPSYVLPLTWRPDFLYGAKSGSPTMECLWTVWAGGHECIYYPLEKPKGEIK